MTRAPRELIAFPRRDRVVLAVVQSEDVGPGGLGRVNVVAEDGARFALPADQVLARFPTLLASAPPGALKDAIASLRGPAETPVPWPEVHRTLPPGATLAFDDLAARLGAADEPAQLRVALALGASEPWLRRDGTRWVVASRDEARAKLAAAEASRRADREDAALREWWPRRGSGPAPENVAGAVEALREFALRGEVPETERGRLLAARLDVTEPDHALEALVAAELVPADVDPSPFRAGLGDGFDAAARDEATRLAAAGPDVAGREDLTGLFAVSVDDTTTIEVDDALSVRPLDGGAVELYVHIADVADAVPVDGPLDAAARLRASTLYTPDGPTTMLPLDVLTERVSLDEGRLRAAVTGVFVVQPDGSVSSSRFVRSLIRVARRLSYEETFDAAPLAATPEDARRLHDAARALRDARIRAGAVVTNLPSLKVRVEGGVPTVDRRHQDTAGDLVVAEAAVLFNAEAGRLFASKDAAAFFRVQDWPRGPEPKTDDPLWPILVRRRFPPTRVQVEPGRHHGVGRDAYAQATSPMRRYADLVNQRQLVAVAAGAAPPYRPGDLERITERLTDRERQIRRASTHRELFWLARWIEHRGIREIDGVLSRAPRRGMGSVWVDELITELPLRVPERGHVPTEGTRAMWKVERVQPWRGRIELAPAT